MISVFVSIDFKFGNHHGMDCNCSIHRHITNSYQPISHYFIVNLPLQARTHDAGSSGLPRSNSGKFLCCNRIFGVIIISGFRIRPNQLGLAIDETCRCRWNANLNIIIASCRQQRLYSADECSEVLSFIMRRELSPTNTPDLIFHHRQ